MSPKQRPEGNLVTDEVIRAYVAVQKLVSNEGRLRVLVALNASPKTWSQLMFETKTNPKSLSDSLQLLIENGLVQKDDNEYSITNAGRALVTMSLDKMVETAEFAVRMASKNRQ